MLWRRALVLSTCTLGELHGVVQVAMEWEGIHFYQFADPARPEIDARLRRYDRC